MRGDWQQAGPGRYGGPGCLALAQEFFGEPDHDGRPRVLLAHAHVIISGRLDAWEGWRDQEPEAKSLTGQLLRVRHNELASLRRFADAARRMCAVPDSPFVIPADVAPYEADEVLALHGRPPLAFARRVIEV